MFRHGRKPRNNDEEGLTYTLRQPIGEEEIALVQEAMFACPTETIGDDG